MVSNNIWRLVESFNTQKYLDSRYIHYAEDGDNVSAGWIGVNCPFCPDGDHANHLGINLDSNNISCFKCKAKGTILKYLFRMERTTPKEVVQVLQKYNDIKVYSSDLKSLDVDFSSPKSEILLPSESNLKLSEQHRNFLIGRKFDPDFIHNKYQIQCVGHNSLRWKFRLIIPIFLHRKLVAWVGRDITDTAKIPYRNSNKEESIRSVKSCVYNIDSVKDTAVVVEGPIDVWRIGDGCVGTFGTQYTSAQVLQLCRFKRVFVLYDAEASDVGAQLAYELSLVVPEVEHWSLDKGDPDNLSEHEVKRLRREVFGKIF